jgi:hypothetical protein
MTKEKTRAELGSKALLDCPFCGEAAKTWCVRFNPDTGESFEWRVGCTNTHCGCVLTEEFVDERHAVIVWNHRQSNAGLDRQEEVK